MLIPDSGFVSGALFIKAGVHLHLAQGAVLHCSTQMENFTPRRTRIEGTSMAVEPWSQYTDLKGMMPPKSSRIGGRFGLLGTMLRIPMIPVACSNLIPAI
ncbi:hypothetical protein, partial [Novosphingobium lindaniclasticum]|uniref:hypothetical protein n=1 Tax=Novosphingobium lindaniclasticum TaxID=1329895 RepID=UPI00190F2330